MSEGPVLCLAVSEEGVTRKVRVTALPATIGRDSLASIRLGGQRSSRSHAVIQACPQGLLLVDLDSQNGTFLGGERIQQVLLQEGDTFEAGGAKILVEEILLAGHLARGPLPEGRRAMDQAPSQQIQSSGEALRAPRARERLGGVQDEPPPRKRFTRRQAKLISWSLTVLIGLGLNLGVFIWFRQHGGPLRALFGRGGESEQAALDPPLERELQEDPQDVDQQAAGPSDLPSAAARWKSFKLRVQGMLKAGREREAASALQTFAVLFPATPEAHQALQQREGVILHLREKLRPLLDELQAAIRLGAAEKAHAIWREARAEDASKLFSGRWKHLTSGLEELVKRGKEP